VRRGVPDGGFLVLARVTTVSCAICNCTRSGKGYHALSLPRQVRCHRTHGVEHPTQGEKYHRAGDGKAPLTPASTLHFLADVACQHRIETSVGVQPLMNLLDSLL